MASFGKKKVQSPNIWLQQHGGSQTNAAVQYKFLGAAHSNFGNDLDPHFGLGKRLRGAHRCLFREGRGSHAENVGALLRTSGARVGTSSATTCWFLR